MTTGTSVFQRRPNAYEVAYDRTPPAYDRNTQPAYRLRNMQPACRLHFTIVCRLHASLVWPRL